jgi:hypothetical protein
LRNVGYAKQLQETTRTEGGAQRITQAKRTLTDKGKSETAIGRKQEFKRSLAQGGNAGAAVLRNAGSVKRFQETIRNGAKTRAVRDMALRLVEAVAALYATQAGAGFNRGIRDTAGIGFAMDRMVVFFRILFGNAGSKDSAGRFIDRMRVVQDTDTVKDEMDYTIDFMRGLFAEARSIAEAAHRGEYYRKQQDTAFSEAVSLRHLFVFIRLLTGAFVRDYIIGRFLKSNEELVLKSPVCREIVLDSKIH